MPSFQYRLNSFRRKAGIAPFLCSKQLPQSTFSATSNPQKSGLFLFLALPCLPAPFSSTEQFPQTKISNFFLRKPTGRTAPHSFSNCRSSNLTPARKFATLSFCSCSTFTNSALFSCSCKNRSFNSLSHSSRTSSSNQSLNFSHSNSPLLFSQLKSNSISPLSSTSKLCHLPQPPNFREQFIAPLIKMFSGISQLKMVCFSLPIFLN
jgi:hypothetical protein